ncbi:LacI family DNA-binding transcriptional regulator [Leifsonia naganoensis]|uniref:LacI family xylobiose transport system transcriptional regulator n=1 Tax=Leifsonia naganoensis TaxID=150025 RepID=A0A853DMW2_9MICO|nr:LacI family DNA-binding transcriptional regulator [Leifsonia naganoensis]NYK08943.1 LacI family xylobiose transport system transcriptional regulator [Leifsonia naganoensis]
MAERRVGASPASPASARPTLEAIAREASVSLSTVSKVLNGRPGVSAATRQRVESLLLRSGYARRGLDPERGGTVEVVVENIESEWSIEILRGVERITRENGLVLTLSVVGDHRSFGDDWIAGVLQRKPLAVVLQFSNLTAVQRTQLRTRNIPVVVVDPAGDPPADMAAVGATNWAGGVAATRHLLDLGHTRIAVISGPTDLMCSRARVAGYQSALAEAGIPFDPELARVGTFGQASGDKEGRRLLGLPERPTAIVAANDTQALGVFDAAAALGLRIPEDVSVVGFDDVRPALWARPPLTTVRQPLQEMAEEATRLALRMRAGEADVTRIELATSLVVRSSTAGPPR